MTTILGLIVLSIGNGIIITPLQAIGSDQFVLPEQKDEMLKFFSMFTMIAETGQLVAAIAVPYLARKFKCFNEDDCYPLPVVWSLVAILFSYCKCVRSNELR